MIGNIHLPQQHIDALAKGLKYVPRYRSSKPEIKAVYDEIKRQVCKEIQKEFPNATALEVVASQFLTRNVIRQSNI